MERKGMSRRERVFIIGVLLAFLFASLPSLAKEKEEDKRPEREIGVHFLYPTVIISQGEEAKVDLRVVNHGKKDEDVLLEIVEAPKGWDTRIATYSYTIRGVHVPNDEARTLTFSADPEEGVGPGTYHFKVRAKTKDGKLKAETDLDVIIEEVKAGKKGKDIVLTTSYPVLQGPSDATFEFSLEVENKLPKEVVLNLSAEGPKDWEINFKPGYEEKYISSLRLKSDSSRTLAIEVKPPRYAQAGEYPIKVTVGTGPHKAEATLKVILTGTYKIEAGTISGLLSVSTQKGKSAIVSLYVKNSGTATQRDISFLSFKPENWKVEFKPEKIDILKPGEIKQVEVTITPAEEALVGDYSVTLNVKGEKSTDDVELRVTVKASTVWGWIGIGIILFVIAGLSVLFVYLGRR